MTSTPFTLLKRAAAAAALAVVLTSCSATGHPSRQQPLPAPSASADSIAAPIPAGRSGSPSGALDPTKADGNDPQAVARAALTTAWTIDTDLDTSQYDAEKRAAGLYTPEHAAALTTGSPRSAPGAEWNLWASHHAYTTVQLQQSHEDGAPQDSPVAVHQRWAITISPHGRDGWNGPPKQTTALVILTRASATRAWRVDTLTLG